jgi:peptidoglycan/LPS O-acetylase OafA/YrhL
MFETRLPDSNIHETRDSRLPYLPGLDGLRALAVLAVMLYHADAGPQGGFLGVETFFVLSGYLITALLLAEWRQDGRIDLLAFWKRRARRLLPALALLLVAVLLFAVIFLSREASALFGDTLASLGFVMNWRLVFSQQSYFDPLIRPSLLQHLWSLAVEEQFYLLWPLLFALGMRYLRPLALLCVVLGVALASTLLMAALFQPDADPSRIYYGTDTRAAALLIGAALALRWTPWQEAEPGSRPLAAALDIAGMLALLVLLSAYLWLDAYQPLLYQGGFAAVSLATALLIAATVYPGSWLGAMLGIAPLRWLGLRSYSLYLWHWPVFMLTRPYLDVPLDGWALLGLRLALVCVLADLTYRLVELPVRRGLFGRFMPRLASLRSLMSGPSLRPSVED